MPFTAQTSRKMASSNHNTCLSINGLMMAQLRPQHTKFHVTKRTVRQLNRPLAPPLPLLQVLHQAPHQVPPLEHRPVALLTHRLPKEGEMGKAILAVVDGPFTWFSLYLKLNFVRIWTHMAGLICIKVTYCTLLYDSTKIF